MKRIAEIDSWRGFLILLVVLGHVTGMACHFCEGEGKRFMECLFKLIYVFHMPAFFFLAGMTWRRREGECFITFLGKKARRLLVPYFVFAALSGVIFYLMSAQFFSNVAGKQDGYYVAKAPAIIRDMVISMAHAGGWPENGVFRGNSVLWFLPAMFSAEVIYWIVDRLCPRARYQLPIVLALYLSGFFVPAHLPWGLTRALNLIAFLAVGRWCAALVRRRMFGAVVALLAAVYCCVCCFTPNHWAAHKSLVWYVAFDSIALLGIVVSYKLAEKLVGCTLFQRLGLAAMGIMLMHKYVVVLLQTKVVAVSALCKSGRAGALLAVAGSVVVVLSISYMLAVAVKAMCPWMLGERYKSKT